HICIEDDSTIQIFDCIEFNPVLRCADIASDLAFLLMDLKRLDRSDLAQDVLAGYGGGPDMVPPALLGLYETHRALVRVKTESLTINSIDGPIESLVLNAIRYLETAFRSAIRT